MSDFEMWPPATSSLAPAAIRSRYPVDDDCMMFLPASTDQVCILAVWERLGCQCDQVAEDFLWVLKETK